ncbi:MAG TPA: hypothetical protein VF611_03545 [Pyrinomonadaceae bacterium]
MKESWPTAAQKAAAAEMRRSLAGTVGYNFEIVRERLARRPGGGGLYWLAHLRAKRSGEFQFRYRYRYKDHVRPRDPLYTFVEHQSLVRVGEQGCARRPRYNFVCVGDTVILPVLVDDYTEHTFWLAFRPFRPADDSAERLRRDTEERGLYRDAVPNPAAGFLKYLGSRAHYMPFRSGGYTMEFEAAFEAVRPGSFNLGLGVGAHARGAQSAAASDAGSVPVVVVERGTPITILLSKEDVHGYTDRFASHSGNNYLTTPVILQTGERLTLRYHGFSARGGSPAGENRAALEASAKDYPPAITLLPFRVDPARDYNDWLVEFLPPRAAARTPVRGR